MEKDAFWDLRLFLLGFLLYLEKWADNSKRHWMDFHWWCFFIVWKGAEKWKQHMKKQNERRSMCALKLGSLFDGIGVFPLAASRNGIIPVWASEIEKSPIAITKRHFPDMEHLGDITKIHGGNISPVHIITFGSPCQNLSKIGKREGLAGSKSGLFFQAIRIIEEMRCATNGLYPVICRKASLV